MKYLNLIWKVFLWNLICFIVIVVVLSFIGGNTPVIAKTAFIGSITIGTLIGITTFQNSQQKLSK